MITPISKVTLDHDTSSGTLFWLGHDDTAPRICHHVLRTRYGTLRLHWGRGGGL